MLCVISFLIFATRCGYATDDDIDDLNPRRQERSEFGRLVYDTIEIDKRLAIDIERILMFWLVILTIMFLLPR